MFTIKIITSIFLLTFSGVSIFLYKKIDAIQSKVVSNEEIIQQLLVENKILKESNSRLENTFLSNNLSLIDLKTSINESVPTIISQNSVNLFYFAIALLVIGTFMYINLPSNQTLEEIVKIGSAEVNGAISDNALKGTAEIIKITSLSILDEINTVQDNLLEQTDRIQLQAIDNYATIISMLDKVIKDNKSSSSFTHNFTNSDSFVNKVSAIEGANRSQVESLISLPENISSAGELSPDILLASVKATEYIIPALGALSDF